MSKPVFFARGEGLTVATICELVGAQPPAAPVAQRRLFDVAPLERAGPYDLAFAVDDISGLAECQAGACLIAEPNAAFVPHRTVALVVADPYRAFITAADAMFPGATRPSSLFDVAGAAATAMVHATARLESGVTIDPAAVIGPRAEVGSGTLVGPLAVIGPGVRIGRNCSVGAGVSLTNALIGDHVVMHAGSRIGEAGTGSNQPRARDDVAPQLGRVIIQDKVQIGANATINRGRMRDTIVGEGTRIASLVQIDGDVTIGRHCIVVRAATAADFSSLKVGPLIPDDARIVDVQLSA